MFHMLILPAVFILIFFVVGLLVPRRYERTSVLVTQVVSGVIAAIVATALLSYYVQRYEAEVKQLADQLSPTCSDPAGLRALDAHDIRKTSGQAYGKRNRSLYGGHQVFDGNPGSIWIPPYTAKDHRAIFNYPKSDTLTISLAKKQNVALVCVNNGLANTSNNYMNWGRTKDIMVWGDGSPGGHHTLSTNSSDDFVAMQVAAQNIGETDAVHIRLMTAYVGQTIESFDPDICLSKAESRRGDKGRYKVELRDPRGCIVAPTPKAGLSEVMLFVKQ